jgi:hypothetical protein
MAEQAATGPAGLAHYRATLDVPRELAWFVSRLLAAERRCNNLSMSLSITSGLGHDG